MISLIKKEQTKVAWHVAQRMNKPCHNQAIINLILSCREELTFVNDKD